MNKKKDSLAVGEVDRFFGTQFLKAWIIIFFIKVVTQLGPYSVVCCRIPADIIRAAIQNLDSMTSTDSTGNLSIGSWRFHFDIAPRLKPP